MIDGTTGRGDTRARIVEVAARLLQDRGPAAVTTRGVAEAAGVQAPAIYRLFGDKDGLLEAVAEYLMANFVAAKVEIVEAATAADADPLDDLCSGWRTQIDFGQGNPAIFSLLNDPVRALGSPAARMGRRVLEARVHRVAVTGRLRVSEHRAVDLIQAAGIGTISTLLSTPPEQRDPGLPDAMLEAVLGEILTDAPERTVGGPVPTAVALRALVPRLPGLSASEGRLLTEWLDRSISAM